MGFARTAWAIVAKDLQAEARTRELLSAMLVFALLTWLTFSFALDFEGEAGRLAVPGAFWATVVFASTLGLSRSFAREQLSGGIDGMLLAPVDRAAIFCGKAVVNFAFVFAVEVLLLPLFAAAFSVPLLRLDVLLVAFLGTVGYVAAGTMLAAIAVNTRAREVMLPILLLPLAVPDLIAAVRATGWLVSGGTLAEVADWIRLIVVYDIVMVTVALLTFGLVVEG